MGLSGTALPVGLAIYGRHPISRRNSVGHIDGSGCCEISDGAEGKNTDAVYARRRNLVLDPA